MSICMSFSVGEPTAFCCKMLHLRICYLSDACTSKCSNCSSQYSLWIACPRDVALSPGFPVCLTTTPKCLLVCREKLEEGRNKKNMGEGCCMLSADLCLPAYVLDEGSGGVRLACKSQYFKNSP